MGVQGEALLSPRQTPRRMAGWTTCFILLQILAPQASQRLNRHRPTSYRETI